MIRKLILTASTVLLTLALAEGVLRVVYAPSTTLIEGTLLSDSAYHRPDPELQIVPRPLVRGEHTKQGSFTSTFTTNSHGLRGREVSLEKPRDVRRIAVIGDSFAWGYGVDDDAIFPALIERRLPGTEVINLGVSGYGLVEETAYFRRLGVRFQPDVLIVALVQNDIVVGQVRSAALAAQETAADTSPVAGSTSLRQRIAANSRLYRLLSDAINGHRGLARVAVRMGIKAEPGGLAELDFNLMPALREPPGPVVAGWDSTLARLRTLHELTDSLGIRLIVALVPALQSVDPSQLRRSLTRSRYWIDDFDVDEPYRRLTEYAHAESMEIIDPLSEFRQAFREGEKLYLERDMHFNERGHALFAHAVVAHLEGTPAAPRR